jgi:hypothetical protein
VGGNARDVSIRNGIRRNVEMKPITGIILEQVGCRIKKDQVKLCFDCELQNNEAECFEFRYEEQIEALYQHYNREEDRIIKKRM